MKPFLQLKILALALCSGLGAMPAMADDIDIFLKTPSSTDKPNVLIVLDNTSNWARQSQKWPGGIQQGQAEVDAIYKVLPSLVGTYNIGLMEFVVNGTANDVGGFVSYKITPLDATALTAFQGKLVTTSSSIFNNITDPSQKRNSNTPYGDLMYDVYNYWAGDYVSNDAPNASKLLNPPAPYVDAAAYNPLYSKFVSPLTSANTCSRNFVIFIGNPNASGPSNDTAGNTAALQALASAAAGGGTAGTAAGLAAVAQLPLKSVTTPTDVTQSITSFVGNSTACYASPAAANAAYGLGYNLDDKVCQLFKTAASTGTSITDSTGASCSQYSGTATATYAATDFQAQCATFGQGCHLNGTIDNPTLNNITTGTTGYLASAPVGADAGAKAGLICPANALSCSYAVSVADTAPSLPDTTGDTNACYYVGNGANQDNVALWTDPLGNGSHDYGSLVCPRIDGNAAYTCTYTQTGSDQSSTCTQRGNVKKATLAQHASPWYKYTVIQTATVPGGTCPVNTNQYKVYGTDLVKSVVIGTTYIADTGPRNADEWARFLYGTGVPLGTDRKSVSTYTIDVYNAQPDAVQTALLTSMAKAGGGKYFAARNEDAIIDALKKIFIEINATNSTFASTSLPVNATNRTTNENQVYIPMFRPDPSALPRWFGNLKRYQLIGSSVDPELGDVNGLNAVNPNTGFVTDCAVSYWTTDSATYWTNVTSDTKREGKCTAVANSIYSDMPDGSLVEKGASAEIVRQGNNPPTTNTSPTWAVDSNRIVKTQTGTGALTDFSTTSSGLSSELVDFVLGKDTENEAGTGLFTATTRPSIHGDVIHSRPLPINYSGAVTIYYGANDGMLRAVDGSTGKERWAFVAEEFYSRLQRLKDNAPLIQYPGPAVTGSTPKDYFFDGTLGAYQNAAGDSTWIYPTMRRGGRMIYALDVSNPASPIFKWKVGCPHLTDDTGCTENMSGIGQTWSTPIVAYLKGYTTGPVVIIGGGSDNCEDVNATSVTGCTKGGTVYVLDAFTGAYVASFDTAGRVVADVALVDINNDGYPDYAYAADTLGNIYRIDFISNPTAQVALASTDWRHHKVAATTGGSRKFQYAPALLANGTKVYVALGSGDREHPLITQYPYTTPVVNRFYMYMDDLAVNRVVDTATVTTNLDSTTDMFDYSTNTSCTATRVLPGSGMKGWFMSLNQNGAGEQTVTSALIAAGEVKFSTNRPITSGTQCSNGLGEARGYDVDLFNASGGIGVTGTCGGTRSSIFVGGGLPPSPVLATSVPVNGKPVTVCFGCVQKNGVGASTTISPDKIKPNIKNIRKRVYSYTSGDN